MKTSSLLPLLSVAIASAASTTSSSHKRGAKRLRHVQFAPRNVQIQGTTDSESSSSPDPEGVRELYESETIDLYQDPCPTDNITDVLTLMPTDQPTPSPTISPDVSICIPIFMLYET